VRSLNPLARYRQTGPEIVAIFGSVGDHRNGVFILPSNVDGQDLRVIAGSDELWEHVSVSRADRCPTWEEMDYIHRRFFAPDDVCVQLHVPLRDHINLHPNTLHIWRPVQATIPLPPSEYV
jgi:hypothetical protein